MSDPRMDDPTAGDPAETGLDNGSGDPNDDRAYLDDLPPAQVQDDLVGDPGETDADA